MQRKITTFAFEVEKYKFTRFRGRYIEPFFGGCAIKNTNPAVCLSAGTTGCYAAKVMNNYVKDERK